MAGFHKDPDNGWTFTTVLAHLLSVMAANDRRYIEMFTASEKATQIAMTASEKAVNAALAAAEKAVSAALAAADRAVQKAEDNQLRVNVGQNEFRGQLRDQAVTLASKESVEAMDRRLQAAEKVLATTSGGTVQSRDDRLVGQWRLGVVISVISGLMGMLFGLWAMFHNMPR